MTDQQIFDTSARGLILQGCKSEGNGQMFGHSFIDNQGRRCALGFLLVKDNNSRFVDFYNVPPEIVDTTQVMGYLALPLELMRIHNCCRVEDWPALLAACAKTFNLDDGVISAALAEVAQRALGQEVKLPELVNV